MQGSILGAGSFILVSFSNNVLRAAKAVTLFPSSFAIGHVLLNLTLLRNGIPILFFLPILFILLFHVELSKATGEGELTTDC
jgi:hypothetical protein